MLDAFEGFDEGAPDQSEFVRVLCVVTLKSGTVSGTIRDAWVYVCPRTPKPERLVPGGKFPRKQAGQEGEKPK